MCNEFAMRLWMSSVQKMHPGIAQTLTRAVHLGPDESRNNPDLDGLVHSTTNHGSGRCISNLYVSENWREQQQKNVNNEYHCFGRIFTNFPIELNLIELSHAQNIPNNSIFMAVSHLIGSEIHCSDSCHQMFMFCDGLVAVDIKCSECGCCGFIEMMKRSE